MAIFSSDEDRVNTTRTLVTFISTLQRFTNPFILDLGPAVGRNVDFLTKAIPGCRLHVEDYLAKCVLAEESEDIDLSEVRPTISTRKHRYDGVLCWDTFDYLNHNDAQNLVSDLESSLRPGGVLMLLHGTVEPQELRLFHYEIVDEGHLCYRSVRRNKNHSQRMLPNRAVENLFPSFAISQSILLKNEMREVLFKRPVICPEVE